MGAENSILIKSNSNNIKSQYKSKRIRSIKKFITILTFLTPALLLYCLFMLNPMIDALRLSFFDWYGSSEVMEYVGLSHYINLFSDKVFLLSIFHNLVWVFITLVLIVVPVLLLAVMISKVKKGSTFFRAAFYLPSVLSLAVVAVLWSKIYDPMMGPINTALEAAGLDFLAFSWLGNPKTALAALILVGIWAFFGFYMILFLAGLQNVDPALYEAAKIDGAGPIRMFFSITIPSLKNTMNVVISMVIIHSFKAFALVWIMTQGGPYYKTEVVSTLVFKTGFSMNKVSYGSAMGVILGVIILTITILFNYLRERNE